MASESAFREEARQALERAKKLLDDSGAPAVRYAVLELRTALEAVVMGQAATLQDEVGDRFMQTWQPRRIMQRLKEVDPSADSEVTLSVAFDDEEPDHFTVVGSTKPIRLDELSKPHNSLGSFLHAPTLDQMDKIGWFNEASARKRCHAAITMLEDSLSSSLFAMKLDLSTYTFKCGRCGEPNHILNLHPGDMRMYLCGKCEAPHSALFKDDKAAIGAYRVFIGCAHPGCENKQHVWADELRAASKLLGDRVQPYEWTCAAGHQNVIVLRNALATPPNADKSTPT